MRTSVLDELVYVGRPGGEPLTRPVMNDPEPALTVAQHVARVVTSVMVAATIILIIGLAIGYAG